MRAFFRRHPALSVTSLVFGLVIYLDQVIGVHAIAIVIALIWMISVADAWDEETMR